jgi:hypothetical protein
MLMLFLHNIQEFFYLDVELEDVFGSHELEEGLELLDGFNKILLVIC